MLAPAGQVHGTLGQRTDVLQTQPASRAGKDAQGRGGILRVNEHARHGNGVSDLRHREQASHANDFVGHAALFQGFSEEWRVSVLAHQNRRFHGFASSDLLVVISRDRIGDGIDFFVFRGKVADLHLSRACLRLRLQRLHCAWRAVRGTQHRVGHRVRQGQDLRRITPGRGQLRLGCW